MIVQACLNGARPAGYHEALPISPDEIAADAARCVAAGAAELHVHPRLADGREGLAAVDDVMRVLRHTCPGTLIGVSTGAWIEEDPEVTRARIANWRVLPDHASVNLSEPDAFGVMELLSQRGVGIEVGLATVADAERFVIVADRFHVLRILIEIEEQDTQKGDEIIEGICAVLAAANVSRPILLHGFDDTVWHFVSRASERRWSTRVGLEDGKLRRDGSKASGNADLIRDAVHLFRDFKVAR